MAIIKLTILFTFYYIYPEHYTCGLPPKADALVYCPINNLTYA